MATAPQSGSGTWHCIVKPGKDTKLFIAHCLDLHVKVAGRTLDEACQLLKKTVVQNYEWWYEFDQEGLKQTAPASDWEEYNTLFEKALREAPDSIKIEHITLTLRAPKVPEQLMPLSCQRVEIAQAAAAN